MGTRSFLPKLLSVEYPNITWGGEKFFVRTTWENTGAPADFGGKVRLELEYFNLRALRNSSNDVTFSFVPYPQCYDWIQDGVYAIGGSYTIPQVWGGARKIYLTFLDGDEMPIPFLGRDGRVVHREYIGQVNFDWNHPSEEMIGQVQPVTVSFADLPEAELLPQPAVFSAGENEFCRDFPGLYRYHGEVLEPYRPRILLRNVSENRIFAETDWTCTIATDNPEEVRYHVKGKNFALDLVYYITGDEVTLQLENVIDTAEIELIAVDYKHLLSLGGKKNYLVEYYGIGRLVDAHKTWQIGCTHPFDVDNFAGMYNENLCIGLKASSLDTILSDSIEGTPAEPKTVLGAKLHYKVANEQPGKPSLLVKAKINVNLRFAPQGDWQTVAKLLRRDLPATYDPVYRNALVSKWMLDGGSGPDSHRHSLEEVKEHVRMIAELTDYLPHIVYITGWQKGGHDHGYPIPEELNDGIPSLEYLRETIKEYREKYNAYLSFHDNFDDAYLWIDFDHSIVATDQFGEPYRGWMWGGNQSHIISPKCYVLSGQMAERVRKQVERFGLAGSYHIDVVTSEVRRYDYSPDMMAAADENFEYKKAILEEFAKYGVDVTSEVLAVPTLGQMSYSWHIRADEGEVYRAEEEIPLAPLMYHGVAGYNLPSRCDESNILQAMIFGAQSVAQDLEGYKEEQIFSYHILSIPIRQFAMMEIDHFELEEDTVRAVYGPDSFIEVHPKAQAYTMQLNGRVLGKDWVSMVPIRPDTCLAYAREEGTYTFCLPEDWEAATAVQLTKDGPGTAIDTMVSGGNITLRIPAGIPVKICKA